MQKSDFYALSAAGATGAGLCLFQAGRALGNWDAPGSLPLTIVFSTSIGALAGLGVRYLWTRLSLPDGSIEPKSWSVFTIRAAAAGALTFVLLSVVQGYRSGVAEHLQAIATAEAQRQHSERAEAAQALERKRAAELAQQSAGEVSEISRDFENLAGLPYGSPSWAEAATKIARRIEGLPEFPERATFINRHVEAVKAYRDGLKAANKKALDAALKNCRASRDCSFGIWGGSEPGVKASFWVHKRQWMRFTPGEKALIKDQLNAHVQGMRENPDEYTSNREYGAKIPSHAPAYSMIRDNIGQPGGWVVFVCNRKNEYGSLIMSDNNADYLTDF